MMASTEEEFRRAVEYIQKLPNDGPYKQSNAEKFRFYALHKQATVGPCNVPRPSWWNILGNAKAKWNAWDQLKEMSKEEAMTMYVEEFRKVKAAYERAQAAQH
jgi:acyl-CoA-binding protein